MLILERNVYESIIINGIIEIKLIAIKNRNRVRIGISAPKEIPIYRKEIIERIEKRDNRKD